MDSLKKEELLNDLDEISLKLLMNEYAESDGERLWREFEEADKRGDVPEIPDNLDRRCQKTIHETFAKNRRKAGWERFGRTFGKVAMIAMAFLGLITALVISVDALRVPVLNFFLSVHERYTVISTDEENVEIQKIPENIRTAVSFVIPDGYALVTDELLEDGSTLLVYEDGNEGRIILSAEPAPAQLIIDTEDADSKKTKINEMDAFLVKKDGFHVVWINPETELLYDVYANTLEASQFWKIVYFLAA